MSGSNMASVCSRDPDKLLTTSNVSYNIVRGSGGRGEAVESEYETPDQRLPPPTSSQPPTAAAGDPLYEPVGTLLQCIPLTLIFMP